MITTSFSTDGSITTSEACEAAHGIAQDLFDRLGGYTQFTDGEGPVFYPAFQESVEDALVVALLNREHCEWDDEELLADQTVSVNVERQEDGQLMYEVVFDVEGSDYGTLCKVKDLATLDDWFDEEWVTEAA